MLELKGKLYDIQIDYKTRKPLVTFIMDGDINLIEDLRDKLLSISLKIFRKKRSLDSNAYFHVLVDKLRLKLNIPFAEMKNRLIKDYGQVMYLEEGEAFIYKTNAPPEYIHNLETIHMWLTFIYADGQYEYRGYRPTHEYDTKEMAQLIEGTIYECKQQGIETATPEELERMNQLWKEKYERSTQAR